jgi:site-specific DNA recombinase
MAPIQAALYARVSSDQQAEMHTIDSQVAALQARVRAAGLAVPAEREFRDEGYSGATLVRPALERLRDLVAVGGVDQLYVHSPDRLARKYAYQVLLLEEFQRAGVTVIFLNRELKPTPEDDLLLQVQGMVAEYERAKILERSRRGKRHAAHTGQVSVLSTAPYGYRYLPPTDREEAGRFEILPEEARVVRRLFAWVGEERLTIGAVTRRLTQAGERTRTGKTRWDRTTVWGMLKNPAYMGQAAFGKTRSGPLQPRLRPQRGDPAVPRRPVTTTAVPPEEWIMIPVPPLVSEALFAAVQEQLQENQRHARQQERGARYLLQGLVTCRQCGYAYYGKPVSIGAAKGKPREYAYYRCIGADAYRFGGERLCPNGPVRTDRLEAVVWEEVRQLLENPQRLEAEYQRRLQPPAADPAEAELTRWEARVGQLRQGLSRLLDSYAEGLMEKEEFEPRLKRLRERIEQGEEQRRQLAATQHSQAELRLILGRLEAFAAQVQTGLATAEWTTRRELIRTLVKRVEIDPAEVEVVFRVPPGPFESRPERGVWQHCPRGNDAALGRAFIGRIEEGLVHVARFQPLLEDGCVHRDVGQQPVVADPVEAGLDVAFQHPARAVLSGQCIETLADRVRTRPLLAEPIRVRIGGRFRHGVQGQQVEGLHSSVLHGGDAQRAQLPVRLGDIHPPERLRLVAALLQAVYRLPLISRSGPGDLIHAGGALALVLGHSSDGQSVAAERVGQQVLQGLHLAPPAFLRCLHDTRLEPTHVLVGGTPVNVVPILGLVGSCTSRVCLYRHLLCFLNRLAMLSREDRPEGSQLAFAPDHAATRIRPITVRPSLSPSSSPRTAVGRLCSSPTPEGSDTGLPCSAGRTGSVEVLSLRRQRSLPMPED